MLSLSSLSKLKKKLSLSGTHRLRHRLELERVPARVPEEHRPLLPGLAPEPQVRLQLEPDASFFDFRSQLVELGDRKREAEVRHGHRVAVDGRRGRRRVVTFNLVAHELVAVEVEVDPGGAGAALGAAEGAVVFWFFVLVR